MNKNTLIGIMLVVIFCASSFLTGLFLKSGFQFIPTFFCFLIAMALIGVLYHAAPDAKNSLGAFLIVVILGFLSLSSSVGGMKIFFYKAQQKDMRNQQRKKMFDRGEKLLVSQDSLLKDSNRFWTTYNLQQNQERVFLSLLELDNKVKQDSTEMSSIYLMSVQLSHISGIRIGAVEMFLMLLFALALDGAGIYCSSGLKTQGKRRQSHKSNNWNPLQLFRKNSLITLESYGKYLWIGVRKPFWEVESLNSQSNIRLARRLEVKYRDILTKIGVIDIRGTQTFAKCEYNEFMQRVCVKQAQLRNDSKR